MGTSNRSIGRSTTPWDVRVWHLEGLCEAIRGPVLEPMPKTIYDDLLIGVMETGLIRARYRGASHWLRKGTLILGQPGEGAAFNPINGEPIRTCIRCPFNVLQ